MQELGLLCVGLNFFFFFISSSSSSFFDGLLCYGFGFVYMNLYDWIYICFRDLYKYCKVKCMVGKSVCFFSVSNVKVDIISACVFRSE